MDQEFLTTLMLVFYNYMVHKDGSIRCWREGLATTQFPVNGGSTEESGYTRRHLKCTVLKFKQKCQRNIPKSKYVFRGAYKQTSSEYAQRGQHLNHAAVSILYKLRCNLLLDQKELFYIYHFNITTPDESHSYLDAVDGQVFFLYQLFLEGLYNYWLYTPFQRSKCDSKCRK